jgi:hypothetical protein
MEPSMYQEMRKILDAKIIFQVRHYSRVANLVPIKSNYEEICLCVDFRNLNKESNKDNYSVPSMEQLLQTISDYEFFPS